MRKHILLVSTFASLAFACTGGTASDTASGPEKSDGSCGDGSVAVCTAPEPQCPAGQVAEVRNHCWGACVDATTCEPSGPADPIYMIRYASPGWNVTAPNLDRFACGSDQGSTCHVDTLDWSGVIDDSDSDDYEIEIMDKALTVLASGELLEHPDGDSQLRMSSMWIPGGADDAAITGTLQMVSGTEGDYSATELNRTGATATIAFEELDLSQTGADRGSFDEAVRRLQAGESLIVAGERKLQDYHLRLTGSQFWIILDK